MVFEDFELIVNKLSQFLEHENALLKDNKKKHLLQDLDEKTHLFLEFHKAVNYLQANPAFVENLDLEKKQNFKLKISFILELAQHNEGLLQKLNKISERILQKILNNVRKINEPLDSYTLTGQKNSMQNNTVLKTLHPISLNHQI